MPEASKNSPVFTLVLVQFKAYLAYVFIIPNSFNFVIEVKSPGNNPITDIIILGNVFACLRYAQDSSREHV